MLGSVRTKVGGHSHDMQRDLSLAQAMSTELVAVPHDAALHTANGVGSSPKEAKDAASSLLAAEVRLGPRTKSGAHNEGAGASSGLAPGAVVGACLLGSHGPPAPWGNPALEIQPAVLLSRLEQVADFLQVLASYCAEASPAAAGHWALGCTQMSWASLQRLLPAVTGKRLPRVGALKVLEAAMETVLCQVLWQPSQLFVPR